MKKMLKKIWEELDYFFYRIASAYRQVRHWFRMNGLNIYYYKLIFQTLKSYPYSPGFFMEVERKYLEYMLDYFSHANFIAPESYQKRCKEIKLALAMIEIIMEDRELWHSTGQMKFKEVPGKTYSVVDMSDYKYYCDVNVNFRNIGRFVRNKESFEIYKNHAHELYKLKATHIYHMIKDYCADGWWD